MPAQTTPNSKFQTPNFSYYLYLAVLFLPLLELGLRILQYEPWRQIEYKIVSQPGVCLLPHAALGFALRPGAFDVSINEGLQYSVTHGADSQRITTKKPMPDSLPEIWMMGCSYTYGMGVDDSLSFPFLLQNRLPQYRIRNLGVPGYGAVQAYLIFKKNIHKNNIPEKIIFNYADFHDERNALSPRYRRDLHTGFERSSDSLQSLMAGAAVPWFEKKEDGDYMLRQTAWPDLYKNWRWREKLALVNFFQSFSDDNAQHKLNTVECSLWIFEELQKLCQNNGIELIITNLTATKAGRERLHQIANLGIKTADISVDLFDNRYNSQPYDSHPNAAAHAAFAKEILHILH